MSNERNWTAMKHQWQAEVLERLAEEVHPHSAGMNHYELLEEARYLRNKIEEDS